MENTDRLVLKNTFVFLTILNGMLSEAVKPEILTRPY